MKKERINEIWGILFLLLGLFTLTSLFFFHPEDLSFYTSHPYFPVHNVTGITGAYLAFGLLLVFGASALLIPILFLLWSTCFFLQKVPEKKLFKFVGLGIALFSTSTLIAISLDPALRFEKAGAIGYLAGSHLLRYFGHVGSYILASSCLLLSLVLATDFLIYPILKKASLNLAGFFSRIIERWMQMREWGTEKVEALKIKKNPSAKIEKEKEKKDKAAKEEIKKLSTLPEIPIKVKQYRPDLDTAEKKSEDSPRKEESSAKVLAPRPVRETVAKSNEEGRFEGVIGSKPPKEGEYTFPSIELLKRPLKGAAPTDNLQENSKILEDTLMEFGIEVKVIEVEQGPVITRYELLPAPGVKVNSIAVLSDDIALALKATSVRLIIPIPGKSAIGVEVPNSVASTVSIRELIDSTAFKNKKNNLPLALGKDTSGKTLVADLSAMPHLLIAGTTGSGKTVCVNSIIVGLLYACTPADLKLVMVDPKMVEMAIYNKIPHMLAPVVTDVKKAAQTLNWVVCEMENRYKLFATVGVRNIQAFNTRPLSPEAVTETEKVQSENVIPARLPYIVVIIDELADLMMVAQDKVEGAITRLAQLSRAVGIHLLLATQRPSVDVITGVIKANFPARISFKVASKVDSRTVIDASGADKLIGRGDMLFMQPGDAKPTRGQAAFIVDEEINAVVEFVAKQGKPEYHPEILATQEGKTGGSVMDKDELFDEAVAVVLETGQASTSNLQRRLRLGYTRAARIIDQMEAEGLVGPAQGAKPRDIYMDRMGSRDAVEPIKNEL
jgi:DNA segregation ATPase FtsK/SpoIIIE, S-DNA-T family